MAKAGMIAGGITVALALGTAGYFANEWRVCRNMEDDFLTAVDGYSANVEAGALAGAAGVAVDRQQQKTLRETSLRLQQLQLSRIYERCGEDAGRAAADLASKELQDSMKAVLSSL